MSTPSEAKPGAAATVSREQFEVAEALRDASERTQIEADFPGLLGAAQDAIVSVDSDGLIRLVNHQAESLFGYQPGELIGRPLDTLIPERARSVHPSHRASYFANPTSRPMGSGLGPTARRKDGTEFAVDISLSSSDTEDGVIVSAVVRDITNRMRIEGEQAEVEANVVGAAHDEERALLEGQLHQAQRLESIGQLAGGVAHDFNNLLAGIMNYACLVSENLEDEMDRRGLTGDEAFVTLVEDIEEIVRVAKRGATLTRQLLTFSHRTLVQPEVLDLNSVVRDMEDLLRRTIGENVDQLVTVFASDLPLVKADRGQIEQVIMNLAVNARDAMPGGGELKIETASFEASVEYARARGITPGRYARMTVSDTGTGMSKDVTARAFEPFFTTKATGEGTGLGLATVYGIVTQTEGEVSISSQPGSGTTVRVSLPATSEKPSESRAPRTVREVSGKGETLLLVEDEEIVREPARRMLVKNGYTVLAAANANDALAIARDHPGPIDLLLTDVVMPGRSGKELSIEVVRQRPATKVLFMSGYTQDVVGQQSLMERGVHLIEKPFSSDELREAVRSLLDGE